MNDLNDDNLNQDNYSVYDELDEAEDNNTGNYFRSQFRAPHANNNDVIETPTYTNGKHASSSNRRNRVFIDPITEVPVLEHYFSIETYPDHFLIEKICDILNNGDYRYKFPKLEPRNIQLWFKNHRAKLKRLKTTGSSGNIETGST